MSTRHSLALAALMLFACTREAHSASSRPSTVILELFTSQGCSSCPPADKLLSTLGRESFPKGRVIPLAYHVDYWNHLGWRDPFSSNQWSARQGEYARAIKGSQLYTPQVIIDGRTQIVGSSERYVRREIEQQLDAGDQGLVRIDRIVRGGDALQIELHARAEKGRANLVVALFENGLTTAVRSGENADRKLANDFIVRWESRTKEVGTSDVRTTITIPLQKGWNPANLGVTAFLQEPSLAILAADVRMPGEL